MNNGAETQKTYKCLGISFLLVLFISSPIEAQNWTITGTIIDESNLQPIEGAKIADSNQLSIGSTSDNKGKFSITFSREGKYRFVISLEGYGQIETDEVEIGENIEPVELLIKLTPLLNLPEMQVEGEPPPELSIGRTEISGKELEQIPGAAGDPMTALRILPGVTSGNDVSATIAVRGSGPQDNADFVDFLPVGYLFHGFPMMSVLRSDLVESFELYAAGFGPEFGDVLGAVIDVKQRDPREDKLGGAFNISTMEADFLLEGPVSNNSAFYIAGRRSYIDKILPKSFFEADGIEAIEIPVFYDYQGKYLWRANAFNTVSLQVMGANDTIEYNITEDSDEAKKDPAILGGFGADTAFHSQGVVWSSDISHQLSNKMALAHILTPINFFIGDTGESRTGDVDVDVYYYLLRNELVWMPPIPHQFTFGVGLYRSKTAMKLDLRSTFCTEFDPDCNYTSGEQLIHNETLWLTGLYLSARDQWRVTSDFTLSLGARYTYENYLNKRYLEPKLGAEYQLNKRTILSAAWGKYHQFPEFTHVVKKFGNPKLTHSKATHSVVGIEHFVNEYWSAKVESYYKTLDDLVVSDNNPDENTNKKFLNEGSGEAYGLELLLKRHPVDKFSGWFSLTLSRSERTNHLTDETFRYRLDRSFMITTAVIYELNQRWSVSGRFTIYSGGRYTPVVGSHEEEYQDTDGNIIKYQVADYGKFNSASLPAYNRMDVRVDYDYLKKDSYTLSFFADIINLYNRKNISGYNWNEDYTERKTTNQLGIFPSLGFRVEW